MKIGIYNRLSQIDNEFQIIRSGLALLVRGAENERNPD